jgi:hypothetical protein
MRYKEFLLEYSREKTLQNRPLMTKVMDAVRRKDANTVSDLAGEDYVLDRFEEIDPTPNKQYIQPIMNMYIKDKFNGFEDTQRLKNALSLFARFKQRLDKRDINQYDSLHELEDAIEPHELELTKKEKRQQGEYHIDPSSYDVFAESTRYVVITPNTSQASCSFGAGTKWCTSSKDSSDYFDEYKKEGPLYIVRTKDANYDKDSIIATSNPIYQFHFESGQFMNVQDRPITLNPEYGRTQAIDPELYSIFKEKFADALTLWVNNFFNKERSGGFESVWSDYVRDVPVFDVIQLMEQSNNGDGLKAVNKMFDETGFTHFRKHYYERYKDMTMYDFIRGINEVIIPKLKKDNAIQEYADLDHSGRTTWWQVTKADIRLYSEIGEYLRLKTYNIYDYEVGGMATDEKGNSLEEIDQHFTRQKKIAIHLKVFQDILSEFGGETADFAEDLQEWIYEYKRIHHWLNGLGGMQGWSEKYVMPTILEKQGHSEDEIQKIMAPLGYFQDIQKFVRDDIMNAKNYKQTWQGLI